MVWKWAVVNFQWQERSTPTFVCESWQRFVLKCYQRAAVCASSSMEYASRVPDGTGNKCSMFICLPVWDNFASDGGLICFHHLCSCACLCALHTCLVKRKWSIACIRILYYATLLWFHISINCYAENRFVLFHPASYCLPNLYNVLMSYEKSI